MAFRSRDRGTILGCGEVHSVWWTFVGYKTDAIPFRQRDGLKMTITGFSKVVWTLVHTRPQDRGNRFLGPGEGVCWL